MEKIYEAIKNDPIIKKIYDDVHIYEDKEKGWAYHDYNHVLNVAKLTEKLLKMFEFDSDFIYCAKIAAILHDVGAIQGKENHAERSYEFAKKYLADRKIEFKNKEQVLEAIKIHSDGFDTENMIALAIVLTDKLDIKHTRIALEGKKIEGNRQYANIDDINISLDDGKFIVDFTTNGRLDIEEFKSYYFTKKVFKAIKSFVEKFNMKYIIRIDSQPFIF